MSLKTEEKNTKINAKDTVKKVDKNEKYEGIIEYDTPAYKKRKKRLGDRYDGRRLRTLPPMHYLEPYLMKVRSDAQNKFEDVIDITNIEKYLKKIHSKY